MPDSLAPSRAGRLSKRPARADYGEEVVAGLGVGQAAFSAASWAAVSAFSWAASSLEWPPQGWPPGPPCRAVPLFSAASWAALSPASWASDSSDLGLGEGDVAASAALAWVRVPLANA